MGTEKNIEALKRIVLDFKDSFLLNRLFINTDMFLN